MTTHDPKRAIVIGAGGIGSWLIPGIARALEANAPGSQLVIVDGDTFENKNVSRQQFSKLGNKAQIVRADIAAQFLNTIIVAYSAWVVPDKDATEEVPEEEEGVIKIGPSTLLQEGDHVFVAVDNYAARALLFEAAQQYDNIDIYTAGNGEDLSGYMYHYIRRDGKNLSHPISKLHPEFRNPEDRNPGLLSCQERAKISGGTQFLAANLSCASWLLSKVAYYMFGTPDQVKASMEITEVQFDMAVGAAAAFDFRVVESVPQTAQAENLVAASN